MHELAHVSVVNPVAEGCSRVRRSVAPSLLGLLESNRRLRAEVRIFEIGKGDLPRGARAARGARGRARAVRGLSARTPASTKCALRARRDRRRRRAARTEPLAWTNARRAPAWATRALLRSDVGGTSRSLAVLRSRQSHALGLEASSTATRPWPACRSTRCSPRRAPHAYSQSRSSRASRSTALALPSEETSRRGTAALGEPAKARSRRSSSSTSTPARTSARPQVARLASCSSERPHADRRRRGQVPRASSARDQLGGQLRRE